MSLETAIPTAVPTASPFSASRMRGRALYLTAGLYALFLGMCVAELVEWRRHLLARGEP